MLAIINLLQCNQCVNMQNGYFQRLKTATHILKFELLINYTSMTFFLNCNLHAKLFYLMNFFFLNCKYQTFCSKLNSYCIKKFVTLAHYSKVPMFLTVFNDKPNFHPFCDIQFFPPYRNPKYLI